MWEWINSLTTRDWIAYISFAMALMLFLPSATSHWLNLYPRFKNWRATKSLKALEKRFLELRNLTQNFKRFRNEPTLLLIDLLWDTTNFLIIFLIQFLIDLFIILILYRTGILNTYASLVIVTIAIHSSSEVLRFMQSVRQKIKYFGSREV